MLQIQLKLKSFDPIYINKTVSLLKSISKTLEIVNFKEIFLPSKIKKITVIRSPHIDKKSREQFQIKKYKRSIILTFNNYNVGNLFLEICKDLHIIGVQMHISVLHNSNYYDKTVYSYHHKMMKQ